MQLCTWVELETEGIRTEWGAMVYQAPVDPKTRLRQKREQAKRPKIDELLPESMSTRAVCAWVARLDGVSVREVYHEWDWIEVWENVAVHLALLKSSA